MTARIDLHTHSAVSDGTDTPAELVAHAHAAGVTTLALTDHDTTAGWDDAEKALRPGMTLIPGAEFSTDAPDGRGGTVSAHLLGYLFDPLHPALTGEQERLRAARRERVREIGRRLAADRYRVDGDELLGRIPESAAAGRPHIARALVEAGVAESMQDAFDRFLHPDKPYYVPKRNTPIADAVAMIREAGGVAVFAHPLARKKGRVVELPVIEDLAGRGLGGVEVDHPDHAADDRAALAELARRHDLLATGSSDYHGANKSTPIAAETTAPAVLEALVARVDRARGTTPVTA